MGNMTSKTSNNEDFVEDWNEYVKNREESEKELTDQLQQFGTDESFKNQKVYLVGTLAIFGFVGAFVCYQIWKNQKTD